MILSWTNARGKMLWKALAHLMPNSGHGKDAEPLKEFVQHPLLTSMRRHTAENESVAEHFPSYLSSGQFGQVLMDILETKGTEAKAETRWEQVRSGIAQMPAETRGSLLALSRDAERNLLPGQEPMSVFQFLAGQWYDAMMNRSTGWYKRLAQAWNFGLGLVLAVACNLNVVAITRALSTNDELRTAFVQKAEASVRVQSELAAKMGVEQSKGARAVFDEAVNGQWDEHLDRLVDFWSTVLLDDERVIHETSPIQPLADHGWRDTLVLTFRQGGFQSET